MEIPEGIIVQGAFFMVACGGIVAGLKLFGTELSKHGEKIDAIGINLAEFKLSMEKRLGIIDTSMARFEGSLESHDERGRSLKDKMEQLSKEIASALP